MTYDDLARLVKDYEMPHGYLGHRWYVVMRRGLVISQMLALKYRKQLGAVFPKFGHAFHPEGDNGPALLIDEMSHGERALRQSWEILGKPNDACCFLLTSGEGYPPIEVACIGSLGKFKERDLPWGHP